MNAVVPVICQNPECGAVFVAIRIFGAAAPGAAIDLTNCTAGPCPKCKATGFIPDGRYIVFDTGTAYLPSSLRDVAVLRRALRLLEGERKKNVNPEVIKRKAKKKIPELRSLWDLIPRKRSEAYTVLAIMVALFGNLVNSCSKKEAPETPQTIAIPPEIHRVIVEMKKQEGEPNKPVQTTTTAVTPAAAQPSRQP